MHKYLVQLVAGRDDTVSAELATILPSGDLAFYKNEEGKALLVQAYAARTWRDVALVKDLAI